MTDLKFVVDTTDLDKAITKSNKIEREIRKLVKAEKAGTISTEQYSKRVGQLASQLQSATGGNIRARKSVYDYSVATREAAKQVDTFDKEVKQSEATVRRYNRSLRSAGGYVNQFGENVEFSGKRVNRLGANMQQAGYQIGDFAVQVQGGTSWLVALGQQGAQLAGIFGPGGAIAGAALAIGTALVIPFTRGEEKARELTERIKELKGEIESLRGRDVLPEEFTDYTRQIEDLDLERLAKEAELERVRGQIADKSTSPNVRGALQTQVLELERDINDILEERTELQKQANGYSGELANKNNLLVRQEEVRLENEKKLADLVRQYGEDSKEVRAEENKQALAAYRADLNRLLTNKALVNQLVAQKAEILGITEQTLQDQQRQDSIAASFDRAIENQRKLEAAEVARIRKRIELEEKGQDMLAAQELSLINQARLARIAALEGVESTAYQEELNRQAREAVRLVGEKLELEDSVVDAMVENLRNSQEFLRVMESVTRLNFDNLNFSFPTFGSNFGLRGNIQTGMHLQLGDGQTEQINLNRGKTSRSGTGGGSRGETQEEFLAKLQREIDLKKDQIGLFGDELRISQEVARLKEQVLQKDYEISEKELERKVRERVELENEIEKQQSLYDSFHSSISNSMMDLITGAASVEDAFKQMLFNIISEIYKQRVVEPVANIGADLLGKVFGFSQGGAFVGGSPVKAFASGGVVNSPTMFPMRGNQTGLMGEAGPEAIMPLKRTANGDLGVQVAGGQVQRSEIVISLSPEVIAQVLSQAEGNSIRVVQQAAGGIVKASVNAVTNERRKGGTMKAAFG